MRKIKCFQNIQFVFFFNSFRQNDIIIKERRDIYAYIEDILVCMYI
jgi:hypothetical protein